MISKLFKTSFLACCTVFLTNSCSSDDEHIETAALNTKTTSDQKIPQEVLDHINQLGMNPNYVEWKDFYLPDGTSEKRLFIEDDIVITPEELASMTPFDTQQNDRGIPGDKQYRTSTLVNQGRTISIIGFTGGNQALSQKERTALQRAVDNYNALNISISFSLNFGTNYTNKDMVVYNNEINNPDGTGGSAGFPSNGLPNKFVQIYNIDAYSIDVVEHVITHEIGHSVGFRHTDYFSRQSCGQNVNEGGDAIQVAGTPSGYDPTSIMLSCFSASEDGEFGNNDIVALNAMY